MKPHQDIIKCMGKGGKSAWRQEKKKRKKSTEDSRKECAGEDKIGRLAQTGRNNS